MRVALAELLFSGPELMLLDEPSNHLDLEATIWLESFLKNYRGTLVVISHERDLLNNVVDHILHLEGGKVTLYPGGYDAFERQRAERLAQVESMRVKQERQRAHLQAFVDRCLGAHVSGEEIVNEVSMAKWWTTDLQKKLTSECLQLHGGYGFMAEYPISQDYADAAVQSIYAGTNEIMKVLIARGLGLPDA